ncbi:MAG: ABC transporter substrate-binding protein [Gammaproteobacteria bacterium]|nr:ABC transporter substrate-binding protein [Gammaproteobacteria bacterium]MDE2345047.1 ABC transporter substrate-binding protein [Gammaproteobacteria bacterium]
MYLKKISIAAIAAAFCCLSAMAATSPSATTLAPDQVVKQTATQMLAAVNNQREDLKKHPQNLYDLIGKILLPRFDLNYATRLVLGPYWRTATPQQRQEFQDAFYKYLVHSYANKLLEGNYTDRNIQVEPWRGDAEDGRTMVRSKVMRAGNAQPVQVDYAMVRTKDGWKAFDVTIEGISYVMNYRNQFGPEIQQKGIDELIQRLNAESEKAPPAQAKNAGL